MTRELTPDNVGRVFAQIQMQGAKNMERTVTAVAVAGELQAKRNASNGSHRKGTPTPARKPNGPARISGNLLRNITHEKTRRHGTVFESAIGVARGAVYGKWVEGLGYEFMHPVVGFLRRVIIPQIARRELSQYRKN